MVAASGPSGKLFIKGEIQCLIIETLDIPAHLTDRTKSDIRMAYTKWLAIHDANKRLSKMHIAGTCTQKMPTLDNIIEMFMSKSSYFKNQKHVFSKVANFPQAEKWLLSGDDAPSDYDFWGYQKPTFENLKKILDNASSSDQKKGKKGVIADKKGKKRDDESDKAEDKKGKGKAVNSGKKMKESGKKTGGSGKKAGSSKSHGHD